VSAVPTNEAQAALRRFTELTRDDVEFAGGKGASLAELTQAGVPVPPDFVVGAPAYAAFCDAGHLRTRVAARLDGLDVEDTAALEVASAEVRAMIAGEPVPESLADSIRLAYAYTLRRARGGQRLRDMVRPGTACSPLRLRQPPFGGDRWSD